MLGKNKKNKYLINGILIDAKTGLTIVTNKDPIIFYFVNAKAKKTLETQINEAFNYCSTFAITIAVQKFTFCTFS